MDGHVPLKVPLDRLAMLGLCIMYLIDATDLEGTCAAGAGDCLQERTGSQVLEVPPVIIGCWQLLERNAVEEKAVATLAKYVDAGFTTFDTADIYGPSERILGKLKVHWSSSHPDTPPFRFFTKYVTNDPTASSAESVNSRSRRDLGVESLDLVQFHWWSLDEHGRHTEFLKAGQQLMQLKSMGKIRHVGACNFDTVNLRLLVDSGMDVKTNQVQYSLLDRRPEVRLLPYCKENGIKLLVFGVVAGGLLSDAFLGLSEREGRAHLGTVSRRMYFDSLQAWSGRDWVLFQTLLQVLRHVADRHPGSNVALVACWWTLRRLQDLGAGGSLILGVRDETHLEEHRKLLRGTVPLTDEDMDGIQSVLDQGRPLKGDIWDRERGWLRE